MFFSVVIPLTKAEANWIAEVTLSGSNSAPLKPDNLILRVALWEKLSKLQSKGKDSGKPITTKLKSQGCWRNLWACQPCSSEILSFTEALKYEQQTVRIHLVMTLKTSHGYIANKWRRHCDNHREAVCQLYLCSIPSHL